MNTVVPLHPPVIYWNGMLLNKTASGLYLPMDSTQGRVETLIGVEDLPNTVFNFEPRGKSMVAYDDTVNMPGEIDYLRASLGYEPLDMPTGGSKIDEVQEVKSLLDSMNKVFLSLLRGSGGDNYTVYQRAIEVGKILRKDYSLELSSYLFGRNWFMVDGELWNTSQNVSNNLHAEGGRIVSVIASKLGIPVNLTQAQEEAEKSTTPVYKNVNELKKAA